MTEPLVSVIMPTYNRAHCICNAINSLRNQKYQNIEIIVIDDGSTDNTDLVIKPYGKYIKFLQQENKGASSARNLGLASANGEII